MDLKKIISPILPIFLLLVLAQIFFYDSLQEFPPALVPLAILYTWALGLLAICFSREKKLPVFKRPNRYFFLAIAVPLIISATAFLASVPFGATEVLNRGFADRSPSSAIELTAFFALLYYVLAGLLLALFFLGGELYWRGFLWEKLKRYGQRGVRTISLIWGLWMLPLVVLADSLDPVHILANGLWVFGLSFALTPILIHYRIQGKSILIPTLFCGSFFAAPIFAKELFPVFEPLPTLIYWASAICLLIGYGIHMKLYSKRAYK